MAPAMRETLSIWTIFLAKRFAYLLVVLLGISIVTFVVTRFAGTPVYLMVGDEFTQEMVESANRRLGLDQPIPIQYLRYLSGLAQGDLGVSRFTFNPVTRDIADRLPATLELASVALIMMIFWAIPAGALAALRSGSWWDRAILTIPRIGVSTTQFWLGLLLIYLFYYRLDWFPQPSGRFPLGDLEPTRVTGLLTIDTLLAGDARGFGEALRFLFLPAFTLAFTISPGTLLVTRAAFRKILATDHIRTARAFGLPKKTIYLRYAFRNAAVPIVTVLAIAYGSFIAGTVLVEVVFSWPGIGRYAVDALTRSNFEPIVALVLLSSVAYAVVYLVTDIVNAIADPRYRLT
jgi:peptide/nickel transport system permease protein